MDLSNNQLSGQALKFQSMVVVRTDVLLDLGRDTAHAHLHSPVLHIVIEIVGGIFYLKKKRLSSNEQNVVPLTTNPSTLSTKAIDVVWLKTIQLRT